MRTLVQRCARACEQAPRISAPAVDVHASVRLVSVRSCVRAYACIHGGAQQASKNAEKAIETSPAPMPSPGEEPLTPHGEGILASQDIEKLATTGEENLAPPGENEQALPRTSAPDLCFQLAEARLTMQKLVEQVACERMGKSTHARTHIHSRTCVHTRLHAHVRAHQHIRSTCELVYSLTRLHVHSHAVMHSYTRTPAHMFTHKPARHKSSMCMARIQKAGTCKASTHARARSHSLIHSKTSN